MKRKNSLRRYWVGLPAAGLADARQQPRPSRQSRVTAGILLAIAAIVLAGCSSPKPRPVTAGAPTPTATYDCAANWRGDPAKTDAEWFQHCDPVDYSTYTPAPLPTETVAPIPLPKYDYADFAGFDDLNDDQKKETCDKFWETNPVKIDFELSPDNTGPQIIEYMHRKYEIINRLTKDGHDGNNSESLAVALALNDCYVSKHGRGMISSAEEINRASVAFAM